MCICVMVSLGLGLGYVLPGHIISLGFRFRVKVLIWLLMCCDKGMYFEELGYSVEQQAYEYAIYRKINHQLSHITKISSRIGYGTEMR